MVWWCVTKYTAYSSCHLTVMHAVWWFYMHIVWLIYRCMWSVHVYIYIHTYVMSTTTYIDACMKCMVCSHIRIPVALFAHDTYANHQLLPVVVILPWSSASINWCTPLRPPSWIDSLHCNVGVHPDPLKSCQVAAGPCRSLPINCTVPPSGFIVHLSMGLSRRWPVQFYSCRQYPCNGYVYVAFVELIVLTR